MSNVIDSRLINEANEQTIENQYELIAEKVVQLEGELKSITTKISGIQKTMMSSLNEGSDLFISAQKELKNYQSIKAEITAKLEQAKNNKRLARKHLNKKASESFSEEVGDLDKAALIEKSIDRVKNEWLPNNQNACFVIGEDRFVYIKDHASSPDIQNVCMHFVEPNKFILELSNALQIMPTLLPLPNLIHLFQKEKRVYNLCKWSVNPSKWSKDEYLPLNYMPEFFIDKLADMVSGDYNPVFDWLMYSLSGSKKENQDHIEQWVLHKVINWDQPTTTPDLIVVGDVGGNGKGLLQSMMKMIYPSSLCGMATSKTLTGDFNSILVGKLLVCFDDQDIKQLPLDKVKQMAGNDSMVVEFKGRDQYEAEKTHSSAWFSNKLPWKLEGGKSGGIDRRFSVMRTAITFDESLVKHINELNNTAYTINDLDETKQQLIKEVIQNRIEIARWFKYLRKKHAASVYKGSVLKPLHGEDYKQFLSEQDDIWQNIWDNLVIPNINANKSIPIFVISELIRLHTGKKPQSRTVSSKIHELAAKSGIKVSTKEKPHVKIIDGNRIPTKKRTNVVVLDGSQNYSVDFDWSLVSAANFKENIDGTYIDEDDLIFQ